MITPRLLAVAVHALLHHDPASIVGDNEAVQIKVEAVLHGRIVDFGDKPACPRQAVAVKADPIRNRHQLIGRAARMLAAATANMQPELACKRRQPALERADHAGSDAGGMPIHSHDGAEGLKPKRMREAAQKFVAAVVMDDGLGDDGAEPRHAVGQPFRHVAAVKRQIGAASASNHSEYQHVVRSHFVPASLICQLNDGAGVLASLATLWSTINPVGRAALDCFVATLLAMTATSRIDLILSSLS